jgi:DNA repair exonuclease SbcCD ATPase subunit
MDENKSMRIQGQVDEPCWRFLRAENFRGFRRPVHFDLSATAVLVHGPNGTGKTSFFDAIQWLLLGDIGRLKDLRVRTTEEYIVNAYSAGMPARVSADLVLAGRLVRIEREGDRSGSSLVIEVEGEGVRQGKDAEDRLGDLLNPGAAMSLKECLFSAGLLQQDDLRYVLQSPPTERFDQLSHLLGLGGLEAFEEDAKAAAKASRDLVANSRDSAARARAEVERIRLELAEAESDESSLPAASSVLGTLSDELVKATAGSPIRVSLPSTPSEVSSLRVELTLAAGVLDTLWTDTRVLPENANGLPDAERVCIARLESTRQRTESLRSAIGQQEQRISELRHAQADAAAEVDSFARFVANAIPFLTSECPICERDIEPASTAARLRERAASSERLEAINSELTQALDARSAMSRGLEDALNAQTSAQRDLDDTRAGLQAISRVEESWTQLEQFSYLEVEGAGRMDQMPDLRHAARTVGDLLRRVDAASGALSAVVRTSRLPQLQDRLERATEQESSVRTQWEAQAAKASRDDALAKASVRARRQVIERRIGALQPLADNIFNRLNPHPTFRRFRFVSDMMRNRGTITARAEDEDRGIVVSPAIAFSSAQANMTSLTYFLALAWSMGERSLPFAFLDDPLQEMDDVNVLAFADLARHLREDRQLFIATHERRYAGLLTRKLAPRTEHDSVAIVQFTGWSEGGPEFKQEWIRFEDHSGSLRLLA